MLLAFPRKIKISNIDKFSGEPGAKKDFKV